MCPLNPSNPDLEPLLKKYSEWKFVLLNIKADDSRWTREDFRIQVIHRIKRIIEHNELLQLELTKIADEADREIRFLIEINAANVLAHHNEVSLLKNGRPYRGKRRKKPAQGSKTHKTAMHARNKKILSARQRGETYSDIGKRFNLSSARIRQICQGVK